MNNTSAHLQVLGRSRLVETRKEGTKVFYRLSGVDVAAFVVVLRDLARSRLPEVDQVVRDYFGARDALEPVGREELLQRAGTGNVVILDVRPVQEYLAGHSRAPFRSPWASSMRPWPGCPSGARSSPTAGAPTACSPPRRSRSCAPTATRRGGSRTVFRSGASPGFRWRSERGEGA